MLFSGILGRAIKAPAGPLPRITIPGIYTSCQRLGLPKSWQADLGDKRALVAMSSGRTAIFRWIDCKYHSGVDWGTHVLEFERYLGPGEVSYLPIYSTQPAEERA